MKSAFVPLFCACLILTACSVIEKPHDIYRPSSWSASDPLTIPHEIRLAQYQKGNLVINPSFEDGKFLSAGAANDFDLTGWEKVGQNISWVDSVSGPDANNDDHGNRHCIKIERKKATELDEPEGILSDFIPVLPGNYYFSYRIRLKDILSNRYRLGVKLFDAITIKVRFFDENKKPVDAGYFNPVSGGLLDDSDKNYSFSNFWRIDDFPWGKVRGRSYNYPFSEGDIPDSTRYVRLFFGLKGTGTLWLDDIYFGYSKWNFTALERFKPFFDKHFTLAQSIIPTPKRLREIGDITYFDAAHPQLHPPVIILPANPAPAERSAAKILQNKICEVLNRVVSAKTYQRDDIEVLATDSYVDDLFKAKLIISIGRSKVYQEVRPDLPLDSIRDKQQGYIIKAEKIGGSHVVFLMGETPIGSYYASTTAVQLFENEKCIYHNATIVDYPDFLSRAYVFKNWTNQNQVRKDLDAIERMSLYKLNNVYTGYDRRKKNWYQPDALYREGLFEAGRICKQGGVMHLAVMVNPYSHFPMAASVDSLDDQIKYTWTHSSPKSVEMLKDVFRIGLEAGAKAIMLLSDDFVPHRGSNRQNYSLYTEEDKKRFVNLQNAQAYIINELKKWIDSEYPGTRFAFCPPWYSNEHIDRSEGKAEDYFKELTFQIPRDVAVVWTGPTIRSLSIDMADLHRYRSLIGRWPMLWDNTLYARNIETKRYGGYTTYYPGKVRMCNLFEPYDTYKPSDFHRLSDSRRIYMNANAYSEVYKIKYATVADYEWNTAAYNPERSLWKVLCRTYGPAGAQKLIRFSDAYYKLYGICSRMELEGAKDHYIKDGTNALTDLNNCLLDIVQALPEKQPLLKELEHFRDKQKKRFEELSHGGIETEKD